MDTDTTYYYCPQDPYSEETKRRLSNFSNICLKLPYDHNIESEISRSFGSNSSSSVTSPVSSSCDEYEEYEESDTGFHAETSKRKIKRKIRARDRDFEIDYLLRRRSLTLQKQCSSASSKKVKTDDEDSNHLHPNPKTSLSRKASNNSSNKSVRFSGDDDENTEHPNFPKTSLSRQSSSCSSSSNSNIYLNSTSCDSAKTSRSSSIMDTKANYYHSVAKLAKQLKSNCDKILDMSVPFVIDSSLLWTISDAINELLSNNPNPDGDEEIFSQDDAESSSTTFSSSSGSLGVGERRANYEHDCMFITDFFEQTPSLCIVLSEMNTIQGSIDITLFRSLQFLELRKIPVHMIAGINTIRVNLKKLKCTRCIDSLSEIFVPHGEHHALHQHQPQASSSTAMADHHNRQQSSTNTSQQFHFTVSQQQSISSTSTLNTLTTLTSVWPELREIDVSFNRIEYIDTKILEFIPSVEILNLSRNRISSIDSSFTRVLNCLTVLNLNYNQLTTIPSLPPNLKVLLLSNNYISHLTSQLSTGNFKSLEILDLSQNVISDELELESFHQLSSLISLALIGNPISYSDSYRTTVSAQLNRAVLNNKQFVLDKKKLSNSEIRHAIEHIKRRRPMVTTSIFMSSSTKFSCDTPLLRFNDMKSLTQSYDSNSSSIRSACRKKAKIKEVVLLDDSDTENIENIAGTNMITKKYDERNNSSLRQGKLRRNESSSSFKSVDSSSADEKIPTTSVQDTKIAIENLREKYGADNWLLRQGGCEVKKLIGISDSSELFSKSLPQQTSTNTSLYSTVTNWEATTSFDDSRPKGSTQAKLSTVSTTDESNSSTSTIGEILTSQRQIAHTYEQQANISDESIKCIDDINNSAESGVVYYSCTNLDGSSRNSDNTKDESEVEFDGFGSKQFYDTSPKFRFFKNGQIFNLIVENQYLYEVDPSKSQNVLSTWDLKSIKSLSQEKNSSETETVEFRLYFDTLKKHMKERTFYMTRLDFRNFEALIHPYLQQNTLEEFSDGFQCIKCNAQFTKCVVTVKIIDKIPREVHVCPNIECQSDLLIPLENIPLPNNESLNLDVTTDADYLEKASPSKSMWGQLPFMRTSTPISGNRTGIPQSLPNNSFLGDLFKSPLPLPSHKPLTRAGNSNQMLIPSSSSPVFASSASFSEDPFSISTNDCVTTNNGDVLTANCPNTKSDSDVEVLSCDSSSIEVLAKNDESASDVEAEEALEILVPDNVGQIGKLSAIAGIVMTESNSSGSFAESVCTTYEKVLGTNTSTSTPQHICQQLNSAASASTSTSTTSISSSITLTSGHSISSQNQTQISFMPIKYDYEDFTKIDHRLRLFCEISVFKSRDEELLALTKALVLGSANPYLAVVIFSNKKIYFYKVTESETEKPDSWLQKKDSFPMSKLLRLDVLIGRHSVGMDFQGGKYFALVFRDSNRTSNFFEYFLCDICAKIESPIVQDISQTQKALFNTTKNIHYFGILRFVLCENADKSYAVSAVVISDDDIRILLDLSWLTGRTGNEIVTTKYEQPLKTVRQVECLEIDATFIRVVFQLEENKHINWELCFETKEERDAFLNCLQSQVKDVPFITLSQPLEP